MRDIDKIRDDISQCDEQIINILEERYTLVKEILECKKTGYIPMVQKEKLELQMEEWKLLTDESEFQEEILNNMKQILRTSRRIQVKRLFPYNIFLIGFMGVGKSTIAAGLCDMMEMEPIEMDALIVKKQNMSIAEIFAEYGESYFRNLESNVLIELQKKNGCIVSCGGGVVMRPDNADHMKAHGRVVLLTATPDTVLNRVRNSDERPILNNNMNVDFINDLMEQRREKYMEAADIVVATDDKSITEICLEIITELIRLDREDEVKGEV